MKVKSIFESNIDQHHNTVESLRSMDVLVGRAASILTDCVNQGGKILLCGNGGSAADSQHLAAELTGRFLKDRRPLPALALSTDTSAITCISNDYSFEEIFARQLRAIGNAQDVLMAISTSGNSKNVIRAAEEARAKNIKIIGLLGRSGGALNELCNVSLIVQSENTARIQECHILIGHTLCELIETNLGLI